MKRTDYCGALRETDVGRAAVVMGWAQNKRDMGGVIFIDLRDREGTLQVVFDAQNLSREDFAAAEGLRVESVVAVRGELRPRSEETRNPRLATGAFELCARGMEVLSEARSKTRRACGRRCGCAIASSTCAARGCSKTCAFARGSRAS